MKKIALYGRVSTEEQKIHGLSIVAQKQTLHKYCEEKGYTNIEEYFDEGVSANAMKKRKQFQRLLEDCRAGRVKLILFTKLDRWFRSVAKYHLIQKELEDLGVHWMAVNEPAFETVTAMGRGNINFYLTTAQIEVDRTAERVKDIFKYKESQGHVLTRLPLGYKVGEDKKPTIDEDTVEVAKFILHEYENIQSIRQLTVRIREEFGVDVTGITVTRILRNKRYTGHYRGKPEYFPQLISMAQYDKNQELLKRNVKVRQTADGKNRIYLFSSLLKCRTCGRKMGSCPNKVKGQDVLTYRCYNAYNSGQCSNTKTITERKLERLMLARLKGQIDSFRIQAEISPVEDDQPQIDLDELRDELQRLSVMYQKRRISAEYYEAECERIESLFTKATLTVPPLEVETVLSPDFDELYARFTREEKRYFWRSIIDYIEIYGREIDPHFLV